MTAHARMQAAARGAVNGYGGGCKMRCRCPLVGRATCMIGWEKGYAIQAGFSRCCLIDRNINMRPPCKLYLSRCDGGRKTGAAHSAVMQAATWQCSERTCGAKLHFSGRHHAKGLLTCGEYAVKTAPALSHTTGAAATLSLVLVNSMQQRQRCWYIWRQGTAEHLPVPTPLCLWLRRPRRDARGNHRQRRPAPGAASRLSCPSLGRLCHTPSLRRHCHEPDACQLQRFVTSHQAGGGSYYGRNQTGTNNAWKMLPLTCPPRSAAVPLQRCRAPADHAPPRPAGAFWSGKTYKGRKPLSALTFTTHCFTPTYESLATRVSTKPVCSSSCSSVYTRRVNVPLVR
jgi:hypothetical protein